IEPIHAIVQALGLPLLQVENVEADDVIGTLAREAARAGLHTLVSTGDKDMAQLVDGHVTLVNTMTDTVYDRETVLEKFGVPPERIVDYLALVGDSIDNIPGIPKVGPKTAAKWLGQYQTLDALVENAAEVSGKVGENLRAGLDTLQLSRKLATLDCDVTLEHEVEALRAGEPGRELLGALYQRLEFRTLLRQLTGEEAPPVSKADAPTSTEAAADLPPAVPRQYATITTLP